MLALEAANKLGTKAQVDQAWAMAGPAALDGPVLSWQQAAEAAME